MFCDWLLKQETDWYESADQSREGNFDPVRCEGRTLDVPPAFGVPRE